MIFADLSAVGGASWISATGILIAVGMVSSSQYGAARREYGEIGGESPGTSDRGVVRLVPVGIGEGSLGVLPPVEGPSSGPDCGETDGQTGSDRLRAVAESHVA